MIVSIHQPQFLPWVPYFLKIADSDVFILLDSVEFQKNGLQNRNRIKTAQGASWLTVPVRQKLGQKILEVRIDNSMDWRKKHWLTVSQNYRRAAAFHQFERELLDAYEKDWDFLVDLNLHLLELMLQWMKISTRLLRSSAMRAEGKGSELVQNLCQEVGATRYVSGVGALEYIDPDAFRSAAIDIDFRPPALPSAYPQQYPKAGFINDLSALDLLLNCGGEWRSALARNQTGISIDAGSR